MKISSLILFGFLVAGIARADVNYNMAKDQAKHDSSQNNASQGVRPATPSSPSAPQPPPMDPALAATLQNIASLRADFDAIIAAANPVVADSQRVSLLNNLSAAAQGAKASSANVKNLAHHLIGALAGQKKVAAQDQRLAREVHALFNSSHLSTAQQEKLLGDLKKVFADAEVPADDAAKVIEDLTAIAAETK